ncbi:MAG TPA: DUF1801 domain-containing protein [Steroidobacteraceae bacterium]|nr:DUF1801 domain-containing protein [Steroidobacteraceae bacterium]
MPRKKNPRTRTKPASKPRAPVNPRLLSGGNPQIAKGYGAEPVETYIAAVPDWRQEIARWVDAAVTRAVPGLRKAVKYNSPLYGAAGREDWFLSLHCYAKYVKVAFFRGAELDPMPPGASKQKSVRYLDIREKDSPDARQFSSWVKQASKLPGQEL